MMFQTDAVRMKTQISCFIALNVFLELVQLTKNGLKWPTAAPISSMTHDGIRSQNQILFSSIILLNCN